MSGDLQAVWLTALLAAITTLLLVPLASLLAWWLARSISSYRSVIEAVVAMPLVLPPTVLGFYLLIMLNPESAVGSLWVELTGESLTFSFSGLVIASVIYSLPFMVQPLQAAFRAVPESVLEAAATVVVLLANEELAKMDATAEAENRMVGVLTIETIYNWELMYTYKPKPVVLGFAVFYGRCRCSSLLGLQE